MSEFQPCLPKFAQRPWHRLVPNLGPDGHDLLSRMLCYDPLTRISARDALQHPFLAGAACPPQRLETALQEAFAARCAALTGAPVDRQSSTSTPDPGVGRGGGNGWDGGGAWGGGGMVP